MQAPGRMDSGGRQYANQVPYSGMGWNSAPPQQSQSYGQPPVYYAQSSHGPTYQQPPPQQPTAYAYQNAPPPQPQPHHHVAPPVSQHQPHQYAASAPAVPQPEQSSESYETSVYVGLEDAPPEFRLAFRVIGEKGQNLEYLSRTTGAKVILRGRGTGIMNNKPLHIYVGHATLEGKEEAESLSNNLVRAVKEEYADWRKTKGLPTEKPLSTSVVRTTNGARPQGRPSPQSELRELTITRDPVGRVKVREEDRRVVQIQRPDHSALSRLGPRVDERLAVLPNRDQQVQSHPHQLAHGRPATEGERRREYSPRRRSRSPIDREPARVLRGSPPSKQVITGERGDLYIKVNQATRREEVGDRGARKQDQDERSRDIMIREERRPKDGLTITSNDKNRDIRTQDHRKSPEESSGRERETGRSEKRHEWPQEKEKSEKHREWSPEKSRYAEKDRRPQNPERRKSPSSRRPPPPRRSKKHSPPPAEFGLAQKIVRTDRFALTVWGQKKDNKKFVPGMHQGELEKVLEDQDFDRLNPIFVVRKAIDMPSNHIWVVGDTALYIASQRAAEHPEGPNLGISRTMILWFGFPKLKIKEVAGQVKEKLGRNLDPNAIILHVGADDLVNYVGRIDALERAMEDMVFKVKKMLPRVHLSWSNILPWKKYPANIKPGVLNDLRIKTNDIAKQLMKKCKGSTLYHDHDFRGRKDGKQVYHSSGFYPSPEGGKCMVLNFMSIIKDLVSRPVRD